MRIISGSLGGRRISPPAQMPDTRPTTDIAKEGLFNILQNRMSFDGIATLDLFGGTGCISYELASRGAASLTIIERDKMMYEFIKKNIITLRIENTSVLMMDVFQYLASCTTKFNFIFAGPPYALLSINELPKQVIEKKLLLPKGFFVLEHTPRNNYETFAGYVFQRNYGTSVFSFLRLNKKMSQPIFITGIGTGIGKTVAAAVVTEALKANYWKPIQAGFNDGTDTATVSDLLSNTTTIIHPEIYKLKLPASPHIAAREEGIRIDLETIYKSYSQLTSHHSPLTIIEGAGGLLVPLNETEFIIDLIKKLNAKVILVSRNYLGSINHSLLTASVCKTQNIDVVGWIFNDQYLQYEEEIVAWSGYPKIASLPLAKNVDKHYVKQQAEQMKDSLLLCL